MKYLTLLFLPLFLLSCSNNQERRLTVAVSFFVGDVKINGIPVSIGQQVRESDTITTSENSSCDINVGESLLRVKEKTSVLFAELKIGEGSDKSTMALASGKILCKPKKLLKDDSFIVKTQTAVAAVRGTQFSVEADANLTTRINVYDGKVKVMKRVKALDDSISKAIENTSAVSEKESVVITKDQAEKAEKAVAKAISENNSMEDVIAKTSSDVAIDPKFLRKFKVEEFASQTGDTINIEEKPEEVKTEIKKKLPMTKASKNILYLTKYEIYLIGEGKLLWQGNLSSETVKIGKDIYVPSPEKIFAINAEGRVIWQKDIINDGKLSAEKGKLYISINGEKKEIKTVDGTVK